MHRPAFQIAAAGLRPTGIARTSKQPSMRPSWLARVKSVIRLIAVKRSLVQAANLNVVRGVTSSIASTAVHAPRMMIDGPVSPTRKKMVFLPMSARVLPPTSPLRFALSCPISGSSVNAADIHPATGRQTSASYIMTTLAPHVTFLLGLSFVLFWVFVFKETSFLEFFVFRDPEWEINIELKKPMLHSLLTCPLCCGFWFSLLAWVILQGHFFQVFAWDLLSCVVYSIYRRHENYDTEENDT